jgi:hypothetical protein
MSEAVEAIFENGVFRPLQPVELAEGERVKLTVTATDEHADDDPAANLPALAIDLGPPDLATNIDYYLYGLPKQKE